MASLGISAVVSAILLAQSTLGVAQQAPYRLSTAEELLVHLQQQAAAEQPAHVEVTDHMDARTRVTTQTDDGETALRKSKQVVLRGNCERPVVNSPQLTGLRFAPPLPDLKPKQCVIVLNSKVEFLANGLDIWLDNIHFRVQRTEAQQLQGIKLFEFSQSRVWMTNVTFQNDQGPALALRPFKEASIHVEDGLFTGFNDTYHSPGGGSPAPLAAPSDPPPPPPPPGPGNQAGNESAQQGMRRILQQREEPVVAAGGDPLTDPTADAPVDPSAVAGQPGGAVPDPPGPSGGPQNTGGAPRSVPDNQPPVTGQPAVALLERGSSLVLLNSIIESSGTMNLDKATIHINQYVPAGGAGSEIAGEDTVPCAVMVSGGNVTGGLVARGGSDMVLVSRATAGSGEVYSDEAFEVFNVKEGTVAAAVPLATERPVRLAPLLTADDNPLKELVNGGSTGATRANNDAPGRSTERFGRTPPLSATSGSDSSKSTAAIIASVVAICVALVLLIGALIVVRRRKKAGKPLFSKGPSRESAMTSTQAQSPSPGNVTQDSVLQSSTLSWGWFNMKGNALLNLQEALDAVCAQDAVFYDYYKLQAAGERRIGGQGLVQFCTINGNPTRNSHACAQQAAIKFYLNKGAFEMEKLLYMNPRIQPSMPATLAIEANADGRLRTSYGYVFPPFVILERGESMEEWADNVNPDFVTIFQALNHAVRCLKELHGAGYAHRDVKPGNILRRPLQHDWTLIDFGLAAPIGARAPLAHSLAYAAPETIAAAEAGKRRVTVSAAVDIWAVGVIAFELVTGEQAFRSARPGGGVEEAERVCKEIRDAITGRAKLPWEQGAPGYKEKISKLRGLKRTVLRCLERRATNRPTAEQLLQSWEHVFDNMHTGHTNPDPVPSSSIPPPADAATSAAAQPRAAPSPAGAAAEAPTDTDTELPANELVAASERPADADAGAAAAGGAPAAAAATRREELPRPRSLAEPIELPAEPQRGFTHRQRQLPWTRRAAGAPQRHLRAPPEIAVAAAPSRAPPATAEGPTGRTTTVTQGSDAPSLAADSASAGTATETHVTQ